MFVYSKIPLINPEKREDTVKQVDLIPTLSTILGIPIPYVNLGKLVLDAIPNVNSDMNYWENMIPAVWANVNQVFSYIKEYSNSINVFDEEKLEKFKRDYMLLRKRLSTIKNDVHYKLFVADCLRYVSELREMCEEVWVQFDSSSMSRGLILIFISIFFVYTTADSIPKNNLSRILSSSFLYLLYSSLLTITVLFFILYQFRILTAFFSNVFFFSNMISVFMFATLLGQHWDTISLHWYNSGRKRSWNEIACRLIFFISLCVFFSNSFVVEEAYVSLFLLTTIIFIIFLSSFIPVNDKIKKDSTKYGNVFKKSTKLKLAFLAIVFCILVRISVYYWHCREEQNCQMNTKNAFHKDAGKIACIVSLISLGTFVSLSRTWLKSCGNITGSSVTIFSAQYAPTLITVSCGGYWTMQILQTGTIKKHWNADTLALLAYSLVLFGVIITFAYPFVLHILSRGSNFQATERENPIPNLFHRLKHLFDQNSDSDVPVVYGLGTTYSAIYIIISIYITLLFALLLGMSMAPSAILLYFATIVALIISSISRYEKCDNVGE